MNYFNPALLGFNIIYGVDGSYVVKNGKLIKIIKIEGVDKWGSITNGQIKFYLENGEIINLFLKCQVG
jgi:hypothetical protein